MKEKITLDRDLNLQIEENSRKAWEEAQSESSEQGVDQQEKEEQ